METPWEELTDPERIQRLYRTVTEQYGLIQRLTWDLEEARKTLDALAKEVSDLREANQASSSD
jgi:uncharacterized coiled-coil protein SlyX